jgi:diguanylate cyclase
MLKKYASVAFKAEELTDFRQFRSRRLVQISGFTILGLLAAMSVAVGTTLIILSAGIAALVVAMAFALKRQVLASAYILLLSMAAMLAMLVYNGAGMQDVAMLGYPGLLVFAAILGSIGLFTLLLVFVLGQSVVLTWLTLNGHFIPTATTLNWQYLVFIVVILLITAYSVFLMVRDMRRLMLSLQRENAKVQKSRLHIQHLAHHDPLTNLPNRVFGEQLYLQLLKTCQQNKQELALLFLDLDNFKPVNDALGHAAGDELLKQLAKRLNATLSAEQKVIRFGGDEFLILVPFNPQDEQLGALATAVIRQTTSLFDILQTQITVTASIGIARAPQDGTDFKQLCRKADIAMYRAKEDGRNTYHFYDESLDQANTDKFKLLQRLRHALENNQFALYYQPKLDLHNNNVTSFEALLRWPQQDGSMIAPDKFIPLAESSGLIDELGVWVIEQACLCCARLRAQGFEHIRMAVNLSVVQFKHGQLPQVVQRALTQAGLPPDALELELTESLLLGDTAIIQQQLNALGTQGVTFAIDDFGTGYSNLSYLRSFNATTLKIDRSFIATLAQWQANEPLIRAIIQMAASLGLTTVAEGIENADMAQRLTELGCNEGQGYHWSPAVAEDKLPALLAKLQPAGN